jgi:hypothetical protein
LIRPRQRSEISNLAAEQIVMSFLEEPNIDTFSPAPYFSKQLGQKRFSAHAYAAMNLPSGNNDFRRPQSLLPRDYMMVVAVDERAVEIKENSRKIEAFRT